MASCCEGRRPRLRRLLLAVLLYASLDPALAQGPGSRPVPADTDATPLQTDLGRFDRIDTENIDDVFTALFGALEVDIAVQTSGNYLFIRFEHDGIPYEGNFRLDAADRDRGLVHFAYFPRIGDRREPGPTHYKAFGTAEGVKVTRVAALTYVVVHNRKAVIFRLSDLSQMMPATGDLGEDEILVGPVMDESGAGFFLVWHKRHQLFLYVLDERTTRDDFAGVNFSGQIRIGRRTRFAIYRDRYVGRWILIGVSRDEAVRNTLYDGPFDQMPDNSVDEETLRSALIARHPALEGRIDRFGNFFGLAGRVIIVPYLHYDAPADLAVVDQCAARAASAADYYRCFDRRRDG